MAKQLDGMDISKLRDGSKKAIQRWFETYADPLYTLVFYRVGRDADAAQDVVQQTFLTALEKIKDYKPSRGDMFAWLSCLSRNCVKKVIRERHRAISYEADDLNVDGRLLDAFAQITTQPLPEDILQQAETTDLVRMVLGSISPNYRSVLRQYYYEHSSIQDIAESNGMSVGAVRVLLHRARASFRQTFLSLTKSTDTSVEKND
jgi:RNA polymerase sigma-70 factor (ECF subfamily)